MFGMAIGQMSKGSSCFMCHLDLSGIRGVQVGDTDYCFSCFDKLIAENSGDILSLCMK